MADDVSEQIARHSLKRINVIGQAVGLELFSSTQVCVVHRTPGVQVGQPLMGTKLDEMPGGLQRPVLY